MLVKTKVILYYFYYIIIKVKHVKGFVYLGVEQALNKRIYGQHLANKLVIKLLRGHFGDHSPGKALVLSFHGSTGGGKNYVSQLIAQHIYKEGLKSKYVHMIPSTIHFKHEKEVEYYKV